MPVSYTHLDVYKRQLQGKTSLASDEGMLFIYEEPDTVAFWMKDTDIPLDIVFIDEDEEVISVKQGIPCLLYTSRCV